jgi:recombination protein RecT
MSLPCIVDYLKDDKIKNALKTQIAAALPKHLTADRMMRLLLTEIRKNPEINECTTQSVCSSIIQASQLGLEIGTLIGHGYLVPFKKKDRKTGQFIKECQFIIGYRGMIDLARRSGKIIAISAQAVYENDNFEFQYGLNEKLNHVPTQGDRGKLIGAYSVAKIENGGYHFGVMFKNEIDKVRERSKSGSSSYSPWETDYEEMAKKTVIRRLFKYLPISVELYENIVKEEIMEFKDLPESIIQNDIPMIKSESEETTKADFIADKLNSKKEEVLVNQ